MTTTGGTTFATTVRMINRVHDNTAHRRTDTAPATGTRLTQRAQIVLGIADFTDGRLQSIWILRISPERSRKCRITAITRHELARGASTARHLRTLAGLAFQCNASCVPTGILRSGMALPGLIGASMPDCTVDPAAKPFGSDDIAALTIGEQHQRDVRAAVRIVFMTLDAPENAVLITLEVDEPIMLIMTAALVTHSDTSEIVASAVLVLFFEQCGAGLTLVQPFGHRSDYETAACGGRFCFNNCHHSKPCSLRVAPD